MQINYKICGIHVVITVAVFCILEVTTIVVVYATGIKHPLMRCHTIEPAFLDRTYLQNVKEHETCTTNTSLLVWIALHLLTDVAALISLYNNSTKPLFPYLMTTFLDLLTTSAYLVVLIVFVVVGEKVDGILVLFMIALVIFKFLAFLSSRKLYWYLKWKADNEMVPRSAIVKQEDTFQF